MYILDRFFFPYSSLKILAIALLSATACATKAQRREQKRFLPRSKFGIKTLTKKKTCLPAGR